MIIVPEIETVVILVPRTGSGALKRAIAARYPKSVALYRHMEADGVPAGYDRWTRLGVVRHPVHRLWSLYKFLQAGKLLTNGHPPAYVERQRKSSQRPFEDWLINNDVVFTNPYSTDGSLKFYPLYSVRHSMPENRKSQFLYLRPDLGTRVVHFGHLPALATELDIRMPLVNETDPDAPPTLSAHALDYVRRVFAWDIDQGYPL
jgi:hypothetical protein